MNNVYYWSPCLTKVGTYKSTINSAQSLTRYQNEKFNVKIINVCGEWDEEKKNLLKNNIQLIDLGPKYFKFLPKEGYFKSRLSYIAIFIISLIPLTRLILKKKPKYLIIHLITSLPLLLNKFFNFKTKLILRISGFPRLNFFRYFFWWNVLNKVYRVTCPSLDLKNQILKYKFFKKTKLEFLADPIIKISDFKENRNIKTNQTQIKKDFFISVGRLTAQKNFEYLINEFNTFKKKNDNYNLLIFGEGEKEGILKKKILNYGLENKVFLMGYTKNIYAYMKKAKALILSSLWEDPGFVLIESALCNLPIISSNCKNGPMEFLENGRGGYLFESNKKDALSNKIVEFLKEKAIKKKEKTVNAKKNCLKYTMFRHSLQLKNILID